MKPFLFLNHSDTEFNSSQVDINYSMAHAPYPYCDPIFSGPLVAYAPQAANQPQMLPQMMGLPSNRVALPPDLAQDGPIYVNAKQYHGILRRRQSRAKLEAQNKLIKCRKPYLHESRHKHALKRVRGSGGRFLSTKHLSQSGTEFVTGSNTGAASINKYQKEDNSEMGSHHSSKTANNESSITTCSDRTCFSGNSFHFRQPEHMFLGNSPNMGGGAPQCSGGLVFGGTKQRASVR
ncbi:unnamed protein product [Lathyrus oleraceus]|uniref:Nuclear transcription factor Y subunit n=1 Tax=Pisum sativum TaxID=3888 RepID=A0A9D5GY32_PEA|nr:nuclear transcription factor Y subunit A-3-like isoform X2 [Pisum sativum]KAI5445531.1 hypothetical protein KIW84_013675 [Pisum sativum]